MQFLGTWKIWGEQLPSAGAHIVLFRRKGDPGGFYRVCNAGAFGAISLQEIQEPPIGKLLPTPSFARWYEIPTPVDWGLIADARKRDVLDNESKTLHIAIQALKKDLDIVVEKLAELDGKQGL